ncbi:hydroxymethylglutaryl-CoA lyase [Virgibacillus sp. NKC19-16]|uniref:hydroxymethylglutaryl-CoA lyase n=1 Tax=Virgibacillus salidurans TaxID=2831673 RepID=UPI001F2F21F3|nr:hydroxymethylglutaryl-CoA lyase [Virgibacillus sp. NKC19-16]UJL45707.1 hydroxymethylglutaryl-CoA lyase [Virgibacillus sp. NKC19-16]
MNSKVNITDVTGRDGFQMEKKWIETQDKVGIMNAIIEAGVKRIEATSFVSPKAVPQLQDARQVIEGLQRENIDVIALVPNLKGAEFAIDANVDEINVVVSVSETHNRKNVNKTVEESILTIGEINKLAIDNGKKVNVGLGTTFGCPFEGLYEVEKVVDVIKSLKEEGVDSFILADTTGMANPLQVTHFVKTVNKLFPEDHFGLHLHNTRGMGLANLYAGYEAGIRDFDAALGGIGGCPFAPGATGNVCLEDIVHMFELMGVPTGIHVRDLMNTAKDLEKLLGYKLPGQIMKAGLSTDTHES